jgi:hypothetical protein
VIFVPKYSEILITRFLYKKKIQRKRLVLVKCFFLAELQICSHAIY